MEREVPEAPTTNAAQLLHNVVDWHSAMQSASSQLLPPVALPSAHPLYYMHTSGTTGDDFAANFMTRQRDQSKCMDQTKREKSVSVR